MCSSDCDKPSRDQIFSTQFQFAWEHFKFHAEQRTRVFHFFLITVGLLLSAFSFLIDKSPYQQYAFLILYVGGILSTFFLNLDIRNTQLLEQSEALLRRLEENSIYPNSKADIQWREDFGDGDIKLGILSRESILKKYRKENFSVRSSFPLGIFLVDNIKHKTSIRAIEIISIVLFWVFADVVLSVLLSRPNPPGRESLPAVFDAKGITWWGLGFCFTWAAWGLLRPTLDQRCEPEALKWFDQRQ